MKGKYNKKLKIALLLFCFCFFFWGEKSYAANMNVCRNGITVNISIIQTGVSKIRDWIFKSITETDTGISNDTPYINMSGMGATETTQVEGIDEISNYVADSTMNGIIGWCGKMYAEISSSVSRFLLFNIRPSLDLFNNSVGNTGLSMLQNLKIVGSSIAILLFAFFLIFSALGASNLVDLKDTPMQLVIRFLICGILIFFSYQISSVLFETTESLWCLVGQGTAEVNDVSDKLNCALFPISLGALIVPGGKALIILVSLVFGIMLLAQFVKLLFTCNERYLIACFLAYIFPVPAGCMVSKNTDGIFKKYIQMFLAQLLLLIFNLIIVSVVIAMSGRVMAASIAGDSSIFFEWMFLFGMIKIGQRMDYYVQNMGLSVATTGGNVMDNIIHSAAGMLYIAKNLGGNIGGAMVRAGATSNNMDLLKKGKTLMHMSNMTRPVDMSTVGNMDSAFKEGNLSSFANSIKPEQIDDSMVNAAVTGNKHQYLNSLNMDAKKEVINRAFGADAITKDASSVDSIKFNQYGGATVSMSKIDSLGNSIKETVSFASDASRLRGNVASITNMSGQEMFYATQLSDAKVGDIYAYQYSDGQTTLSTAESMTGSNFSAMGDYRKNINSVEVGENGNLYLRDSEDNICARIDKNGSISYNMDVDGSGCHTWNTNEVSKLSAFTGIQNLQYHDNGNGTVSAIGIGDDGNYKSLTLYNKATYEKENVMATGVYRGAFGSNNKVSGNYMVVENRINKSDKNGMKKLQHNHALWASQKSLSEPFQVNIHKKH